MSHIRPSICEDFRGNSSTIINKKSVPAPTFEYSVICEEGIQLFVDMNSSLSDFRKRFENEIHTCNCFQMNKFKSFREELQYLGCKFEQRKNSFVSDTNSCANEKFDSGQFNIVKHNFCQDVSEQFEQEGENSVSCCLDSVANDLVDVNSNLRGVMVGNGAETVFDDQNGKLLNQPIIIEIESSDDNKPFSASSPNDKSLLSVDQEAHSIRPTDASARNPTVTGTSATTKLRKKTEKLRAGDGCKRKRRMNEYSQRILRSVKKRKSYPRNCKIPRSGLKLIRV